MQCPHHLVLVKPRDFAFNAQTAASNAFQQNRDGLNHAEATVEFEKLCSLLQAHEICFTVFDSPANVNVPDAVFPNNWFAVLPSGQLILFPMLAPNRRLEVNPELVEQLKEKFSITTVTDLSPLASEGLFLEGTGSIVFDHDARMAYACESVRTDIGLLEKLCHQIGYTPYSFLATDVKGEPIYHTNVVMSVGAHTVIACLESISDVVERSMLRKKILSTGKTLVEIDYPQLGSFCGNVLQVQNSRGQNVWLMSQTAFQAFTQQQREQLEESGPILHAAIPVIETLGGGSLRCMLAGIHAPGR